MEWKRDLADDANEVAKDVAALANARGGLLVYGVDENRATSAATAIEDVAITDTAIRAYRSKLFARLNPVVPGLAVKGVAAPAGSDSSSGLLVVQVRASPDAPHVVGTGRTVGVPYRVATQTRWIRRISRGSSHRRCQQSVEPLTPISETTQTATGC